MLGKRPNIPTNITGSRKATNLNQPTKTTKLKNIFRSKHLCSSVAPFPSAHGRRQGWLCGVYKWVLKFYERNFIQSKIIFTLYSLHRIQTLLAGGWTNPSEKICAKIKFGSFPRRFGVNIKKYVTSHHLDYIWPKLQTWRHWKLGRLMPQLAAPGVVASCCHIYPST